MKLATPDREELIKMLASLIEECVDMNDRITAIEKSLNLGSTTPSTKVLSPVKQPEPRRKLNTQLKHLDDILLGRPTK